MSRNDFYGNALLASLLLVLTLFISYAISHFGQNLGIVILCLIGGLGLMAASFIAPKFGFYLCIFLGFIISTFERILLGIITLDFTIEILVYVILAGIVLKKHLNREKVLSKTNHVINYAWLIYLAFLLLEVFNPQANSVMGALFFMRKTIELIVIYIISLEVIQTYKDINFYFKFWILMSVLCGLYACYQQWVGLPGFEMRWVTSSDQLLGLYYINGEFRKWSSLTDPAAFGILMACTAVICLVMAVETKSWMNKILLVVSAVIMILGMAYSGTRTATFSLIGGLVLYVFLTINKTRTLLFAVVCTFLFIFVLFAPIYSNTTLNRVRSSFDFKDDNSYKVRNTNRERIRPYILSHPIGGGSLTTGDVGTRFYPGHPLAGFPSDSRLLKTALEYGWIGLILVCSLYFIILQQGVHLFYRVKKPFAKIFVLAVVTSLFSTIISQYSQIAIGASPGIFLFYPTIAILIRISKLEKIENK